MVQEHQPHATNNMCKPFSLISTSIYWDTLQSAQKPAQKPAESLAYKYSEAAAKEAGKETVKYASDPNNQQQFENEAQQKYDDAKAQAEVCFTCHIFPLQYIWKLTALFRFSGHVGKILWMFQQLGDEVRA